MNKEAEFDSRSFFIYLFYFFDIVLPISTEYKV